MNTLIFDCDGTLIDSYGAIVERLFLTYQSFGVDFSRERIRNAILHADTMTVNHGVCAETGIDEFAFYDRLAEVPEDYTKMTLLPNCIEMLKALKAAGVRLFVYTHRGESTNLIFEHLGILPYFEEMVTSTYHLPRKPAPDGVNYIVERYGLRRDEVYYVGDRALDINCGKNAGVKTIFLRTEGLEINCEQADLVVDNLMEIPEAIGC